MNTERAAVVRSFPADLSVEVTWPRVGRAHREWRSADSVATVIREEIPEAEVWFTGNFMGIRQPIGPDIVAIPGDTLIIVAGEVRRP